MALGLVIFLRARGLVGGDRLDHAFHDAALADRSGAMGAPIVPGEEFVADPEHANFRIAADDDLAVAIGVVLDVACRIFRHCEISSSSRSSVRGPQPAIETTTMIMATAIRPNTPLVPAVCRKKPMMKLANTALSRLSE